VSKRKTRWTRDFKLQALSRMDDAPTIMALAEELGVSGFCCTNGDEHTIPAAPTRCRRLAASGRPAAGARTTSGAMHLDFGRSGDRERLIFVWPIEGIRSLLFYPRLDGRDLLRLQDQTIGGPHGRFDDDDDRRRIELHVAPRPPRKHQAASSRLHDDALYRRI
jgi:hypothetical protein